VLDKTPSTYQDLMHDLLDQVLEPGSQRKAQSHLEKVSGELEEESPEALEGGLLDATRQKP
jgi:hypothetical protein